MKKFQTVIGFLLVIAWVLFALTDMWFDVVTMAVFIKISISVLALFLLFMLLGLLCSKTENTKHED